MDRDEESRLERLEKVKMRILNSTPQQFGQGSFGASEQISGTVAEMKRYHERDNVQSIKKESGSKTVSRSVSKNMAESKLKAISESRVRSRSKLIKSSSDRIKDNKKFGHAVDVPIIITPVPIPLSAEVPTDLESVAVLGASIKTRTLMAVKPKSLPAIIASDEIKQRMSLKVRFKVCRFVVVAYCQYIIRSLKQIKRKVLPSVRYPEDMKEYMEPNMFSDNARFDKQYIQSIALENSVASDKVEVILGADIADDTAPQMFKRYGMDQDLKSLDMDDMFDKPIARGDRSKEVRD